MNNPANSNACPHKKNVREEYDPRGPDGQGRNRLRLEVLQPEAPERCLLRPKDLRALWAGIERAPAAEPTLFGACDCTDSPACPRKAHSTTFGAQLTLREGDGGRYWLLNRRVGGFGERGYTVTLEQAAAVLVDVATRHRLVVGRDDTGTYVEAV